MEFLQVGGPVYSWPVIYGVWEVCGVGYDVSNRSLHASGPGFDVLQIGGRNYWGFAAFKSRSARLPRRLWGLAHSCCNDRFSNVHFFFVVSNKPRFGIKLQLCANAVRVAYNWVGIKFLLYANAVHVAYNWIGIQILLCANAVPVTYNCVGIKFILYANAVHVTYNWVGIKILLCANVRMLFVWLTIESE